VRRRCRPRNRPTASLNGRCGRGPGGRGRKWGEEARGAEVREADAATEVGEVGAGETPSVGLDCRGCRVVGEKRDVYK
jgi:hypothetical protein